jgi:glutamine amidotransferase
MCRWAAYIGAPIFLSEVVTDPKHSLVHQSQCATECQTAINADGFGLAWYGEREEPGLYRDVHPAWSDPNLRSLAYQVKSGLFMAHVRASTGTATSHNNCHPFAVGKWSFMHNGQVGGFNAIRKDADMMISNELYDSRKGATDSEALFLIALDEGLDTDPHGAMLRAVARLQILSEEKGATPHMRLAAALSDGQSLYAVRYASDAQAPSLYYRWSDTRNGWAVVSEPLETDETDWIEVPPGCWMRFSADGVERSCFAPDLHRAHKVA